MPSQIQLRHPDGIADPDYNLTLRYENTVNTPIVSCTDLDTGQLLADVYTLAFTKTGGAFTVTVTCGESPKNPFEDADISITCDGVTENTNVIPGLSFVFSASIVTGWEAAVSIGAKMTSAGATTDMLNTGIVDAGSNSTAVRVAAVNVGDADAMVTTVRALPGFWWTQAGAGDVLAKVDQHADDTLEHTAVAGTYTITFTDWADGTGEHAGYKTCNIYSDDGGGAVLVATTAVFDGTSRVEYGEDCYNDADDPLPGLCLILANSTDDPSAVTITLTVRDGDEYVELAPDSAGSPGAYQSTDLTLTESGESAGTITTGGTAYFWYRVTVPDDGAPAAIRSVRLGIRNRTV